MVERNLAKVEVAGSNPVFRSFIALIRGSDGGIGRHAGLKIQWAAMPVRVQVPLRVQQKNRNAFIMKVLRFFLFKHIPTCLLPVIYIL
ncbi:conserved hypothetical protein [Capnocytophaga canimorsus]|uniref:Uncharacterized protein n=1 Tax=Capnocytophaga canimorsus TaxID=28188 RepID=A0A0B7HPR1_9FLAO|nr:conserved hypothetical protein [Capnocytophaga canimorsus]